MGAAADVGSSRDGCNESLATTVDGDTERCFLLGTVGGEGSSLDLLLLVPSNSLSWVTVGVGSEMEAPLRECEDAPGDQLAFDVVSLWV